MNNWTLQIWAIVGAPTLFGIYVHASYRYANSLGKLPFSMFPEWQWFAIFGLCAVSGVASVNFLPFRRSWIRIAINAIYIPVIVVTLLFIHLMVACANGDCL